MSNSLLLKCVNRNAFKRLLCRWKAGQHHQRLNAFQVQGQLLPQRLTLHEWFSIVFAHIALSSLLFCLIKLYCRWSHHLQSKQLVAFAFVLHMLMQLWDNWVIDTALDWLLGGCTFSAGRRGKLMEISTSFLEWITRDASKATELIQYAWAEISHVLLCVEAKSGWCWHCCSFRAN